MRILFTWMAVLGVLAGFCGRALAADPCEVILAMHELEHHSGDHHHHHPDDPVQPCDPLHDEQCPAEHHHHGACGQPMPLAAELHAPARLSGFGFSLSPMIRETEVPPDGPFAELDKPPLI